MTPRRRKHQESNPVVLFYYPNDPRGLDAPHVYDVADFNAGVVTPMVEIALADAMIDYCTDWIKVLEMAIEDANNTGDLGLSTHYAEMVEDWRLKRDEFMYVQDLAVRVRSN